MNTLKAYLQLIRLDKPVGILLLLWPTLWALWLAWHGMPPIKLLFIFILGTITTRSAGCIINDIFDRHFDKQVTRTQHRPLAASILTVTQAFIPLTILVLLSVLLLWQLNRLSIVIGCFAAFIAYVYPLMKRFTDFPQIVLGIAFSMGVPMAFASALNQLPARCFLLFFIAILWPIVYDTAYAMTDAEDDQKIGIKSTALFFQKRSAAFIGVLQSMIIVGFIVLGLVEQLSWIFYLSVAISAGLFLYQQHLLKHNQSFAVFLNNQWLGFIIWLGIAFGISV